MIAQFDINTIWRRKFGEALRRHSPETLLIAPRALGTQSSAQSDGDIAISLPLGWAGATAWIGMPILRWRTEALAARRGGRIDAAIFTSFHYLPLARSLRDEARIVYYCSDDYRGYAGWGGAASIDREAELCRLASLSIFVSMPLRDRAIAEYGLDPITCVVAPNASEHRFLQQVSKPAALSALKAPVFGVVGGFNERIDYNFLERLAASSEVGSLALIGPIWPGAATDGAINQLRANPKVHWFGAQPHDEIHAWMAGIDIAVIPYAQSDFNHFCSPMRLWDHLAIGQPIVATDACDQVARQRGVIVVPSGGDLDRAIESAKAAAVEGRRPHLESWDERAALVAPLIIGG
ncbi:MAG: glycosyltransferase [Sphingomonas sp.]